MIEKQLLLDTSSIFDFVLVEDIAGFSHLDSERRLVFNSVIEAIVFNEKVCLDRHSFDLIRRDQSLIEIDKIYNIGVDRLDYRFKFINSIFGKIGDSDNAVTLHKQLIPIAESLDYSRLYPMDMLLSFIERMGINNDIYEVLLKTINPEDIVRLVEASEEDPWGSGFDDIIHNLSGGHPLVRVLYYNLLQIQYSCNFLPHPRRAALLEIDPSGGNIASSLLKYFNDKVRQPFEERKRKLFGDTAFSFSIPMITSYLLNGVGDWEELTENIMRLKDSKEAKHFRNAISYLAEKIHQKDNLEVEKMITQINKAAESWSKSILNTGETKSVKVSIPIIGVSTDFDVPVQKFTINPADDILIFIHAVLSKS